jgi:glycolate oxidase FAD binding subunit
LTSARAVPDPGEVVDRVRELLGPEGVGTLPVACPRSSEETSALLRVAREAGWRVWPEGAGVGRDLRPRGLIERRSDEGESNGHSGALPVPDLRISTLGMDVLLEHEPADLMARAGAGLRLSGFQGWMGREGQWLALDPPGGPAVSLGGVVASGSAGPLRLLYGRPRDQILGLTLVDGAGRILELGGRVVKNVAGFDLVRLAAGSRGTLGIVTEVTLRLYPLPEEDRTLIWTRESLGEAWSLGRALAMLPLPLAAAELLGGRWEAPLEGSGFRVLVRLLGSARAVSEMGRILIQKGGLPSEDLEGEASRDASRVLSEGDGAGPIDFRAHVLPDRTGSVLDRLEGVPLERFSLHLLHGALRGTMEVGGEIGALAPLAPAVTQHGGSLRVLRAPGAVPDGVEVGVQVHPGAAALHTRIAEGFDPGGILPGAWWEGWR